MELMISKYDPKIIINFPKEKISITSLLIRKIKYGKKNYLDLLDILLKKIYKINDSDMNLLRI